MKLFIGLIQWLLCFDKEKQYVANRVKEICQLTSKDHLRHCPGQLNPAGLLTHGLSGDRLLNGTLWWEGPLILMQSESEWSCEVECHVNDVAHQELVRTYTHILATHSN